jgi:hypothetical protein
LRLGAKLSEKKEIAVATRTNSQKRGGNDAYAPADW